MNTPKAFSVVLIFVFLSTASLTVCNGCYRAENFKKDVAYHIERAQEDDGGTVVIERFYKNRIAQKLFISHGNLERARLVTLDSLQYEKLFASPSGTVNKYGVKDLSVDQALSILKNSDSLACSNR